MNSRRAKLDRMSIPIFPVRMGNVGKPEGQSERNGSVTPEVQNPTGFFCLITATYVAPLDKCKFNAYYYREGEDT
jgi:hypothetical protein